METWFTAPQPDRGTASMKIFALLLEIHLKETNIFGNVNEIEYQRESGVYSTLTSFKIGKSRCNMLSHSK